MCEPKFQLTEELAREIRDIRIKNGETAATWRYVAEVMADRHPELNIDRGNQIDGMWLCEQAMIVLNETIEDGWN